MKTDPKQSYYRNLSKFKREFFDSKEDFTFIGTGSLGGKASGLAFIKDIIESNPSISKFNDIQTNIPRTTVILTDLFDSFMEQNDLNEVAFSDMPDDRIAHAFQKAALPAQLVGDLRALITKIHQPLAIRSSSLLEDAMYEPFAGIYETKMIPNNQIDADTRFHKLVEAIKYVYSSTYFKAAKDYIRATKHQTRDEKMAVIIQEVIGQRSGDRFYPIISGVARSHNYYPMGRAKPQDGVVNLALGLGKTIVDGGISWIYSPGYPNIIPPFGSIKEFLNSTQTRFWAIHMGTPPAYNPIKETEYLVELNLSDAEQDNVLKHIASTYNAASDRIDIGIGNPGPRIITFAPILDLNTIPLNQLIKTLLKICEDELGAKVEIEFALTLDNQRGFPARFGFLQVRPMVVSDQNVEISEEHFHSEKLLVASENVMGNGIIDDIQHIVFVKPENFESKHTKLIAEEISVLNRSLVEKGVPYLLIGFGRWGSSDPWLGIPVNWSQVSGAKIIVETTLPQMHIELSQGSHFFHNITSFQISYFSLSHTSEYSIDWDWLNQQQTLFETEFIKHIKTRNPLYIMVDGNTSRGVILRAD